MWNEFVQKWRKLFFSFSFRSLSRLHYFVITTLQKLRIFFENDNFCWKVAGAPSFFQNISAALVHYFNSWMCWIDFSTIRYLFFIALIYILPILLTDRLWINCTSFLTSIYYYLFHFQLKLALLNYNFINLF